jgi:hypothetical protein
MEYRDLLPFDEYVQRLFLPALRQCSDTPRYDSLSAAVALFEALRWLEFGIDGQLFSYSAGQKLIEDYGSRIAEQYRRFPTEFHYVMPELTHIHLRKMIELRELSRGIRFENPTRISMHLEMLIEMVATVYANQCATSLNTALVFLRKHEWEHLLSGPIASKNILDSIAGASNPWTDGHRGYVLGGCLQSFAHLENMWDALDYLRRPEEIAANDWATLRQTVYEIHGWRFAFRSAEFLGRFTEVCSVLSEIMADEFANIGVSIERDGLKDYLKDIVDRWNGLGQPIMRSAAT